MLDNQERWHHWLKWELEIFREILIHCALLYPISMVNWELMVWSLACIIISLYYEVMERYFYRKAVKLVKPDQKIFLVKIISYMSSGIGQNKTSCLKNTLILPVSTSAVQISAKGALFFCLFKNSSCALELFRTESTLHTLQLVTKISNFYFRQRGICLHYRCILENQLWIDIIKQIGYKTVLHFHKMA